ncbi:MAG: helix-turn-helix transcriptional regulator [Clostridiales bacterium]|jgi:DNA-binding CsgD family transcriptional regulator|nr:helix-turn-helix transcriptional regulator [Clostridiales bacterium]
MIKKYIPSEAKTKASLISLPMFCMSLLSVWHMSMWYFIRESAYFDSPGFINTLTFLIIIASILSVAICVFMPNAILIFGRAAGAAAFTAAFLSFVPLNRDILSVFYYTQCFTCVFMAGLEAALIINIFREESAVKYLLVLCSLAQLITAVFWADSIKIDYVAMKTIVVTATAPLIMFSFHLPSVKKFYYSKNEDNEKAPKRLVANVFILSVLSISVALFGTSTAERIQYGTFVLHLASALFGIASFFIYRFFGVSPVKIGPALLSIGEMGFIIKAIFQNNTSISLIACALLGAGLASAFLLPCVCLIVSKRYRLRFLAPIIISIAFAGVLIHRCLFALLIPDLTPLYMTFTCISIVLLIIYLIIEPYLISNLTDFALYNITDVDKNEMDVEKEPDVETALESELSNGEVNNAVAEPDHIDYDSESFHTIRVEILLTHALSPLTPRERQLVECILRGFRRAEIAREMGVLPETVTKYSNAIYNKFGIHRRQDLFKLAEFPNRD